MIATSKYKYPQQDRIKLSDLVDYYEVNYVVFATRGQYVFANDGPETTSTNLRWSDDNGQTWTRTYAWAAQFATRPVYNRAIKFAHIFADGTLVFATAAQMYISTNKLVSVTTLPITGYTLHTPTSASFPGSYFQPFSIDEPSYLSDGREIVVIGNYHNLNQDCGGAATVVFYLINNGSGNVTLKKVYEFGQNPNYRDTGTHVANSVTGTLVGDAANSEKVRHCHCVIRRPGTLEWYACYGDSSAVDAAPTSGVDEIKWAKHVYDEGLDSWTTTILFTKTASATRWKTTSIFFIDDVPYFNSDGTNGVPVEELGMFKVPIANAGDDASSTRIFNHGYIEASQLKIDSRGNVIVSMYGNNTYTGDWSRVIFTTDYGYGRRYFSTQIQLAAAVPTHVILLHPPDSRGYYFIQCGYINTEKKGTFFVKFK